FVSGHVLLLLDPFRIAQRYLLVLPTIWVFIRVTVELGARETLWKLTNFIEEFIFFNDFHVEEHFRVVFTAELSTFHLEMSGLPRGEVHTVSLTWNHVQLLLEGWYPERVDDVT